jgi:Helix-turn-helix domain
MSKLLLRHEIVFEGPGSNWTVRHREWLGRLELGEMAYSRAARQRSRPCSGHHHSPPITLIDAISASQRLRLSPTSLKLGARNGLIPHYRIGDQIRFDPVELDRWVREHLDGIRTDEGI